jgi:hypothetical protein
MTDTIEIKKLESDLDLAETRLAFKLRGIRHAEADPIVRGIGSLIDAKIALAGARQKADALNILRDLVEACEGEVEEVFQGEIGRELDAARRLLADNPAP